MATKSTDSTQDEESKEELDQDVETSNEEDETEELDADDQDDEEDEQTDDESDDSDEEDDDFQPRFTQFKGKDPKEYVKKLEDGYFNSSKEAVALAKEVKDLKAQVERVNQLIATNPELAKTLDSGAAPSTQDTQVPDQAVLWAKAEMERTFKKEYDEFIEEHPEVLADPKLQEEIDETLQALSEVVWRKEKRQIGMGEGLKMAWKLLEKDDSDEKLRIAAKDAASQGKSSSAKKGGETKSKFSESQIKVAMEMMNVDRETAIKSLSMHVK